MRDSYVDDVTITNGDPLWRRIHPDHYIYDDNLEKWRISSAAFCDSSDGTAMSVVLGNVARDGERTSGDVIAEDPESGLVSFTAGLARELRLGVMRVPLDGEPAHAEVFGKKTRSVKTRLVQESEWLIRPTIFTGE